MLALTCLVNNQSKSLNRVHVSTIKYNMKAEEKGVMVGSYSWSESFKKQPNNPFHSVTLFPNKVKMNHMVFHRWSGVSIQGENKCRKAKAGFSLALAEDTVPNSSHRNAK
jgi:hypothetical protein